MKTSVVTSSKLLTRFLTEEIGSEQGIEMDPFEQYSGNILRGFPSAGGHQA